MPLEAEKLEQFTAAAEEAIADLKRLDQEGKLKSAEDFANWYNQWYKSATHKYLGRAIVAFVRR